MGKHRAPDIDPHWLPDEVMLYAGPVEDQDAALPSDMIEDFGELAIGETRLVDKTGGKSHYKRTLKQPLSACVLTDVALPVPSHMTNEPDVLEACHRLCARVGAYAGESACVLASHFWAAKRGARGLAPRGAAGECKRG